MTIYFGPSHETSDFIVDCLESWWDENAHRYPGVEELAINLDNGPAVESHRTQFIRRMVEFSHKTNLRLRLIYYPPYHSNWVFRMMTLACPHEEFPRLSYESACNPRGSMSTKRQ